MATDTKTIRFIHHYTYNGIAYVPGQVAAIDSLVADQLIQADLAVLTDAPPPPAPQDPFPQYVLDTDLELALQGYAPDGTPIDTTGAVTRVNGKSGPGAVTVTADDIPDGTAKRIMTGAERSKLDGVADGATRNDTDVNLRDRSTHTGFQPAVSISDLTEAIHDTVAAMVRSANSGLTFTYDDTAGTLTFTVTGIPANGTGDTTGPTPSVTGAESVTVNTDLGLVGPNAQTALQDLLDQINAITADGVYAPGTFD